MTAGRTPDADIFAARRWRDRRDRVAGQAAPQTPQPAPAAGQGPRQTRRVDDALALGSAGQGSIKWLQAAAEGGSTEAMVRLGAELVDHPGRFSEAERWLRQAAEAGDPHGQLHYGRLLLFDGRAGEAEPWLEAAITAAPELAVGLVSDLRRRQADELADKWQQKAAEAGDAEAALDLAIAAIKRGDRPTAERWAQWARQLGHPDAESTLAVAAMESGDEQAAWTWMGRAAANGNVNAASAYGLYLVGEGRAKEAQPFLKQVAQADIEQVTGGDPEEMYLMALAIMELHDRPATIRAFENAARKGSAEAALMVGRFMLADDRWADGLPWLSRPGVTDLPDGGLLLGMAQAGAGQRDAAIKTYTAAARSGDARAAHKLGVLYENGGDPRRAIAWYERAADEGEASAMFNLGLMFASRDPALGERWMRKAAECGHQKAPYRMAALAAQAGREAEMRDWLRKGAAAGDQRAVEALADLARHDAAGGGRGWRRRGR